MMVSDIIEGIKEGDKRALARGITLLCSHLKSDYQKADNLLKSISNSKKESYRIGVSGIGGVGKSTFIGALGEYILKQNTRDKVAVLTIDPSSPKGGGSILGDGLRMGQLTCHERAFVRSVANQGVAGAVISQVQEISLLLEAAGYEWIFIESVGAGQSDSGIAYLCDLFISLQMPASGDAVQALKKGTSELADILVIHKYDGTLKTEAEKMQNYYKQTHSIQKSVGGTGFPEVLLVSSIKKQGLKKLWELILENRKNQLEFGGFYKKRQEQRFEVFKQQLGLVFQNRVFQEKSLIKRIQEAQTRLGEANSSPLLEARDFVESFLPLSHN